MELFILIGGCYALYTVGMAIATTIDYHATNKEEKLVKLGKHRQFDQCHNQPPSSRMGVYNTSINNSHDFMSTLHHEDMLLTIYDEVFDEFPHLDEDKKLEMVCQRFEDLCQ